MEGFAGYCYLFLSVGLYGYPFCVAMIVVLTVSFPELAKLARLMGNSLHLFFLWVHFLLG